MNVFLILLFAECHWKCRIGRRSERLSINQNGAHKKTWKTLKTRGKTRLHTFVVNAKQMSSLAYNVFGCKGRGSIIASIAILTQLNITNDNGNKKKNEPLLQFHWKNFVEIVREWLKQRPTLILRGSTLTFTQWLSICCHLRWLTALFLLLNIQ